MLASSPLPNKDEVARFFEEFHEKVETFKTACNVYLNDKEINKEELDVFSQWFNKHMEEVYNFEQTVIKWLQYQDVAPSDSASNVGSKVSNTSRGSGTSSLRAKLAEQKARRLANESVMKEKRLLEEETIARQAIESKARMEEKYRLEELERQKSLKYEEFLQQEIENLEIRNTSLHPHQNASHITDQNRAHENLNTVSNTAAQINTNQVNNSSTTSQGQLLSVLAKQNEISMMLLKNQESSNLPKYEPEVFDGSDLTKYRPFMQSFDLNIDAKCSDPSRCFFLLERYTAGLAKQLIRACRNKDPTLAYQKARRTLEKEFGDESKISNAYLEKLNKWSFVKNEDGKAMQELAIFLADCSNLMNDVTSLCILNSPCEIMKVINKLPYKFRDKWRNHTLKLKNAHKSLGFSDLCEFVQECSDLLNQSIFGDISDNKQEKPTKKTVSDNKKKSFDTKVTRAPEGKKQSQEQTGSSGSCPVCKKTNHRMVNCKFFAQKSYDDKVKFIKEKGLCFRCLFTGHFSKNCKYKSKCEKCEGQHLTLLHKEENKEKNKNREESEPEADDHKKDEEKVTSNSVSSHAIKHTGAGVRVLCPAIPVKIRVQGSNKYVVTYMGLDTYCSDVFMDSQLLQQLGINTRSETKTNLTTMCCKDKNTTTVVINDLEISDLDENVGSIVPVVFCKDNWPFILEDSPKVQDWEACPHLSHIPFNFVDSKIGLLVGANQPHLLKTLEVVNGPEMDSTYATKHALGWALNGPIASSNITKKHCHFLRQASLPVNDQFADFCAKEFYDLHGPAISPSVEDKQWENKVRSTLKKCENGHFEVGLPFKTSDVRFPYNKVQAKSRLNSLKKRFILNNEFFQEYRDFMDMMLKAEFAELVPDSELCPKDGKVWYLVHFGVFHKQKKKIRIVFDASLKYQGISLNSMLLQGPDLTNNLLGVLLRFRQEKIAFMADVRKMFYQVKVRREDRDYLRFLWFPNNDLNKEPREYRITVHVFGAVSSPSVSNFVLQHLSSTIEAENFSSEAKEAVTRDFYVDDLLMSTETSEKAVSLLHEVTDLLATGKFELVEVVSNSKFVLSSVPNENLGKGIENWTNGLNTLPKQRALGIGWNISTDQFSFEINLKDNKNSKRGILSVLHSLYDPLGLLAPVVVRAKRIFQLACSNNLNWDDQLPIDLFKKWEDWLQEIPTLDDFLVSRCYKIEAHEPDEIQLHIFCDGSELAYAAVAYLRFSYKQLGKATTAFVLAKSRLVPLKTTAMVTVPRIELNAAKLAVTISLVLKSELQYKINKTFYWSDSTTVLRYIFNKSTRFYRYVANRLSYIREHSSEEEWNHVPGNINPADIASRGVSLSQLVNNNSWLLGPEFLTLQESLWPKLEFSPQLDANDNEVSKAKVFMVQAENRKSLNLWTIVDEFLCLNSCWFQVKRMVAMLIRLQNRITMNSELTVDDLIKAEYAICIYLQKLYYDETIKCLQTGKELSKQNSLLKLSPLLDSDNILRVGGRLEHAEISYEVKHPILLPGKHPVVHILIRSIHCRVRHLGKEVIVAELRKKYWVVGARVVIKRIIRECLVCQKLNANPVEPFMGELPKERVTADNPAFTSVGIDCFGPFTVKRGRTETKRYGVVFTCMASRAIHLEIVYNLSADSFIDSFRRFIARRGQPVTVFSDNGTNFVGAVRELSTSVEEWNDLQMKDWLKQNNINWKFNPPAASNFGGAWEREIRTIRKTFNAVTQLQNIRLNDEELYTLMCEIEGILNSRPITPVSDDPNDFEALTPNHLLLARNPVTFPPGLFNKDDVYTKRRWRQIQYLADQFWIRWRKEYLPILQERKKWLCDRRNLEEGDLVLLTDQNLPRNQWSLGRVINVIKDRKDTVRVADIRVAKIKGEIKSGMRTSVLRRPVSKLILLLSKEALVNN